MGDVQVSADYDAHLLSFRICPLGESCQICPEVILPLHPVLQSLQTVLCVRGIDAYKEEILHLQCYDTAFVVMFVDTQPVCYRYRVVLSEHRSSGIALLVRIVPV